MQDVYVSTFDAITGLVERLGSQRAVAKLLGVPSATISDILRGRDGHISRERENEIRAALALEPLPLLVTIPACPDCGNVHHGRCNGKPVAIRPAHRRREPQRIADYPTRQLAEAIRKRYVV
jgi:transcriptional regulator with XRE-family HTH domain